MRRKHHSLPLYPVERWATYPELQRLWQLTAHQAIERCRDLRHHFAGAHSVETITIYGLDNPYMSDDARLVMLNDCERISGFKRRK